MLCSHPTSGTQAAIQASLKSVIYYASFKFKRLSESFPQDPPLQRAINETKMNMCEGKKVMPLFKGRILFVFLNRSGSRH